MKVKGNKTKNIQVNNNGNPSFESPKNFYLNRNNIKNIQPNLICKTIIVGNLGFFFFYLCLK